MDKEPHPDDYDNLSTYGAAWDEWNSKQLTIKVDTSFGIESDGYKARERSPRGHRMPDTREQFELMGDLYEQGFFEMIRETGLLRAEINNLKQKIDKYKQWHYNDVTKINNLEQKLEVYRRQLSECD